MQNSYHCENVTIYVVWGKNHTHTMKKVLLLSILLLSVLSASAQNLYTFRKTYWGMSRAEVLKSEAPIKPNVSMAERLEFHSVAIGEVKCKLFYEFHDNTLVRTEYYYRPKNNLSYGAITLYGDFIESLTEKYGDPLPENTTIEDLQGIAPVHSVLLSILSVGSARLFKAWKTPSTLIVLSYWQKEDEPLEMPVIMLNYYSIYAKPSSFQFKKVKTKDL